MPSEQFYDSMYPGIQNFVGYFARGHERRLFSRRLQPGLGRGGALPISRTERGSDWSARISGACLRQGKTRVSAGPDSYAPLLDRIHFNRPGDFGLVSLRRLSPKLLRARQGLPREVAFAEFAVGQVKLVMHVAVIVIWARPHQFGHGTGGLPKA